MTIPNIDHWTNHQCRVVFFDFTVRGTGDPSLIEAVLELWRKRGILQDDVYELWSDALEWRQRGHLLPGWADPAPTTVPAMYPDSDNEANKYLEFVRWRLSRNQRIAV
ncbi:MAG: hypothetical protein AB7J35_14710 [Dehalococcoidia bacterium]